MPQNARILNWNNKAVWLVGASSGIGRATGSALHAQGAKVFVSARDAQALNSFVAEHPGAVALPLDATDAQALAAAAQTIEHMQPLDLVVYCAGFYQPLRATSYDLSVMLKHEQINYVGALNLLQAVLPQFLKRQSGHISLISSVAGFSGLPQSLAYGPTKAALINLAEALYVDLRASKVGVSVINPGFVQTPLTAHNDFSMPALISPEQAACEIVRGWELGEFEIHFPKRFTRLMKFLRLLPYPLYFAIMKKVASTL